MSIRISLYVWSFIIKAKITPHNMFIKLENIALRYRILFRNKKNLHNNYCNDWCFNNINLVIILMILIFITHYLWNILKFLYFNITSNIMIFVLLTQNLKPKLSLWFFFPHGNWFKFLFLFFIFFRLTSGFHSSQTGKSSKGNIRKHGKLDKGRFVTSISPKTDEAKHHLAWLWAAKLDDLGVQSMTKSFGIRSVLRISSIINLPRQLGAGCERAFATARQSVSIRRQEICQSFCLNKSFSQR